MLVLAGLLLGPAGGAAAEFAQRRVAMVDEIRAEVAATARYLGREGVDPRVLRAMAEVPRHELVPAEQRGHAYENRPLPIGYGQTISQPYIVAIMTDLVQPGPEDRVLEVGTGSGYQAAVLAELAGTVCSIEIIPELARRARRDLGRLGYGNIRLRTGDGYFGWEACGPFDAIVVTAGASHVPPPLLDQLAPGGRMIIPVGSRFTTQQLLLVEKDGQGSVSTRGILPVRFVPLTGGH